MIKINKINFSFAILLLFFTINSQQIQAYYGTCTSSATLNLASGCLLSVASTFTGISLNAVYGASPEVIAIIAIGNTISVPFWIVGAVKCCKNIENNTKIAPNSRTSSDSVV